MSVIELAELRYFWQQRAPSGHRLQLAIQSLADKYDFTIDERLLVGKAMQEFADELLAVHGRLEAEKRAQSNKGSQAVPELCEWNPVTDEPAVLDGKQHIGCANEATLSVGRVHNWHLCSSCAELPRFKRMTRRTPLRSSPGR